MGSFISSAMDDNMKKQQVFMVENQVTMLERNMNMQNAMRERIMATQVGLEMDHILRADIHVLFCS